MPQSRAPAKRDKPAVLKGIRSQKPFAKPVTYSSHDTKHQPNLTGVLLLLLIGGASAIDGMNKNEVDTSAQDKKKFGADKSTPTKIKHQVYKETCQQKTLETYNKPNITLGASAGHLVPKACLSTSAKDDLCQKQTRAMQGFTWTKEENLDRERKQVRKTMDQWRTSINPALLEIAPHLSESQVALSNKILASIDNLVFACTNAKIALTENGGNCAEHTRVALKRLITQKLKYGLDIKIQEVKLEASQPRVPQNEVDEIHDHIYLLLDSNVPDISISKDKEAVKAYLDRIQEGKICDPWNHGYYATFKNDKSGFYHSDAGWDTLKTTTISLDFSQLKKLPPIARDFLCKQLTDLELVEKEINTCALFQQKKPKPLKDDKNREIEILQNTPSL